MERLYRQKINTKTLALYDMLDKMDLIIYITFHSKAADHTFFSSTHGIFFFKIDQILGHKSSLSKFKKFEIILGIFSNHKVMRLEINKRKKKNLQKHKQVRVSKYTTKQNHLITKEIKQEIKNVLRSMKNETQGSKIDGTQQSNSKRAVYRFMSLP